MNYLIHRWKNDQLLERSLLKQEFFEENILVAVSFKPQIELFSIEHISR